MPTNVVTYRTDNIVKCTSNTTQSDSHLTADIDPTQPTRRLKFVTRPNPIRGWTPRPMSISVTHARAAGVALAGTGPASSCSRLIKMYDTRRLSPANGVTNSARGGGGGAFRIPSLPVVRISVRVESGSESGGSETRWLQVR